MWLISGATGHLGSSLVKHLLTKGAKGKFAVLARDAQKAKPYLDQGIEVRLADFDQPETLADAFKGIETFVFISTASMERGPQQVRVVQEAAKAGIERIIYTGFAMLDVYSAVVRPLMQSHFETEEAIKDSGMRYTILRNSLYTEALRDILGPKVLEEGIYLPGGQGKVPYALRDELAEATANVLLESGHDNQTYVLTGAEAWGFEAIAQALSRLTGKDLPYREIAPELLSEALKTAGLPEFMVWFTTATLQDIRNGQYDVATPTLETLLKRPPKGLEASLAEIYAPQLAKG